MIWVKCVSGAGFEPPSSRLQIPRLTPRPHFYVVVNAPILSVNQGKFDLIRATWMYARGFAIVLNCVLVEVGFDLMGRTQRMLLFDIWCLACVLWFDICVYRSNVVMTWRPAYGYFDHVKKEWSGSYLLRWLDVILNRGCVELFVYGVIVNGTWVCVL